MSKTERLDRGTLVYTAPGATFGSDALLLARFARPKPRERAVDLCSGCGMCAQVCPFKAIKSGREENV